MSAEQFVVKDSGARQSFASGMIRDTTAGKTDFEKVYDGPMADRWAVHLTNGAVKYPDLPDGTPNWMQANGQAELVRFRKSAMRHFRQWLRGDRDEDHGAAVFFNINGYEYVRDRMAAEIPEPPATVAVVEPAYAGPVYNRGDMEKAYNDFYRAVDLETANTVWDAVEGAAGFDVESLPDRLVQGVTVALMAAMPGAKAA